MDPKTLRRFAELTKLIAELPKGYISQRSSKGMFIITINGPKTLKANPSIFQKQISLRFSNRSSFENVSKTNSTILNGMGLP